MIVTESLLRKIPEMRYLNADNADVPVHHAGLL